jgi:hypothetical protein
MELRHGQDPLDERCLDGEELTVGVLERRQTGVLQSVQTSVFMPFWWSQGDFGTRVPVR